MLASSNSILLEQCNGSAPVKIQEHVGWNPYTYYKGSVRKAVRINLNI
jgi:hypothetical protein